MFRSRIARSCAAAVTVLATTGLAASAAQAAPTIDVDSWSSLPAAVTSAQQVWEPTKTLGMGLHSTTRINAETCDSNYTISALYGNGTAVKPAPSFSIEQTAGDCDLDPHTYWGKVATVKTKQGRFVISAGCGWDAKTEKPVEGYNGGPCKRKDVKTDGGLITLMPGQAGGTQLQVESSGLTFGQLVAITKGLKPLG